MGLVTSTTNAGATYVPIATQTLGSSSSSVTFSSIPQTYTDLVLVFSGITNAVNDIQLTFNSDTGTNYSRTNFETTGSSIESGYTTNHNYGQIGYVPSGTTQGTNICNIMNYANTVAYKTFISKYSAFTTWSGISVSLWRSTSAITSVGLTPQSSTFNAGTTFTLYGIKAA